MKVRDATRSALSLLSRRDRRLLTLSMALQAATAILDLVGILLIGLVGALTVTTIQSQPPPTGVADLAAHFGLEGLSGQALVAVFAAAAASVLLSKSITSSYLTRRVFKFLANRQALVTARLTRELLSRPLAFIQQRASQETAFALLSGTNAATVQLLGQMVIAVGEFALLILAAVALLLVNPVVALGAIVFFALVGFALQRTLGAWASRMGAETAQVDITSYGTIQEALSVYREISVANRRSLYVDRIQGLRWRAARMSADTQFLATFPKYMFEIALVIGGFVLAGALFATQDPATAMGTLALALAAATRVMPSLLRLQGATLGIRTAVGVAEPTLNLAFELGNPIESSIESPAAEALRARIRAGSPDFTPSITVENVDFAYPGAERLALSDVSLFVKAGWSVALVGRSGAGKSTLADVILGLLEPQRGQVMIDGKKPTHCVERWPGSIAYVPQDIVLANGTIRSNVALGLPEAAIDDDLVWEALKRAHLDQYLLSQREGLDTVIGENGLRLSGGQRQRVGIARALYTRPRLILLDEATSALDSETEQTITETIRATKGSVTRIVIAHRLSTVRDANLVVYMKEGRILASGSFDDVARRVPEFGRQAELMGIDTRNGF